MADTKKIIALITDFGTRDYFVGAMKGKILSINPMATIIDVTHEVGAQNIREAAFTLEGCYRDFPAGTIFVGVVDPGVGTERRAIAAESKGYYFVAPDNGLLSFILAGASVFELTDRELMARELSSTFHGRDIFAPVAAHLSRGMDISDVGLEINDPVFLPAILPDISTEATTGEILHVDRFGNLITNLASDLLPENFEISISGRSIKTLRASYAEAESGELFITRGSAGFIEICVREASASALLKVFTGERLILTGGK